MRGVSWYLELPYLRVHFSRSVPPPILHVSLEVLFCLECKSYNPPPRLGQLCFVWTEKPCFFFPLLLFFSLSSFHLTLPANRAAAFLLLNREGEASPLLSCFKLPSRSMLEQFHGGNCSGEWLPRQAEALPAEQIPTHLHRHLLPPISVAPYTCQSCEVPRALVFRQSWRASD